MKPKPDAGRCSQACSIKKKILENSECIYCRIETHNTFTLRIRTNQDNKKTNLLPLSFASYKFGINLIHSLAPGGFRQFPVISSLFLYLDFINTSHSSSFFLEISRFHTNKTSMYTFQQRKDNFAGFTKWQMCDQSVAAVQTELEHLDSTRSEPVELSCSTNQRLISGRVFYTVFTLNYHFNGSLILFVLSLLLFSNTVEETSLVFRLQPSSMLLLL